MSRNPLTNPRAKDRVWFSRKVGWLLRTVTSVNATKVFFSWIAQDGTSGNGSMLLMAWKRECNKRGTVKALAEEMPEMRPALEPKQPAPPMAPTQQQLPFVAPPNETHTPRNLAKIEDMMRKMGAANTAANIKMNKANTDKFNDVERKLARLDSLMKEVLVTRVATPVIDRTWTEDIHDRDIVAWLTPGGLVRLRVRYRAGWTDGSGKAADAPPADAVLLPIDAGSLPIAGAEKPATEKRVSKAHSLH